MASSLFIYTVRPTGTTKYRTIQYNKFNSLRTSLCLTDVGYMVNNYNICSGYMDHVYFVQFLVSKAIHCCLSAVSISGG